MFEPQTTTILLFWVPYNTHLYGTFITLTISTKPGHYHYDWSTVFDDDGPSSLVLVYFSWAKRLILDPYWRQFKILRHAWFLISMLQFTNIVIPSGVGVMQEALTNICYQTLERFVKRKTLIHQMTTTSILGDAPSWLTKYTRRSIKPSSMVRGRGGVKRLSEVSFDRFHESH